MAGRRKRRPTAGDARAFVAMDLFASEVMRSLRKAFA
jgi:hypothetical protein